MVSRDGRDESVRFPRISFNVLLVILERLAQFAAVREP
jgi:hypothetical protein